MAPPQFDLQDLALPAGLAVAAIFIFIAILVLADKFKGKKNKVVKGLGKPEVDVSTVFVKEGDNVVRRSTRVRKGTTPLKEEAAPTPAKTATRTASKTPAKTPSKASITKAAKVEEAPASPKPRKSTRTPRA